MQLICAVLEQDLMTALYQAIVHINSFVDRPCDGTVTLELAYQYRDELTGDEVVCDVSMR